MSNLKTATMQKPLKPYKLRRVSQRQIQSVVERIAKEFAPERIILFGSYAYGTPRPGSDVDLLIVMDSTLRPIQRRRLISRALSPHPFSMDVIVRTPRELDERLELGDFFLREITSRGKVMYARADKRMD